MYRARMIPCLLLKGEGLVKTIQFKNPNYIGDPINAIRLFNEKEVDELIFLDIEASKKNAGPNMKLLARIADQCFMPLCYGGGVTTIQQMKEVFALGFEKISINLAAHLNPQFVVDAVNHFGSSSIVGTMDVETLRNGKKTVKILNGKKDMKIDPVSYAQKLEELGVGEILVNDITNDGMMNGYDYELLERISSNVNVPIIACGGAGCIDDCKKVVECGASAAAAGSLFVYWGRLNAVLINYPDN